MFSGSKRRLAAYRKQSRGRGWHLGAKREVLLARIGTVRKMQLLPTLETHPRQRETGLLSLSPSFYLPASSVTLTGPTSQGYLEAK